MHLIMTRMGPNSNGCQRHGAWLWLARDSCCRDKQCKDRKRKTILQRIHGQNYVKNIQHIGSEKIRYVNIFLIFHSQLDDVKFCLCHASLQLSLLIGSERRGGGGEGTKPTLQSWRHEGAWVRCWFSSFSTPGVFLRTLRFPPLNQNQLSDIAVSPETVDWIATQWIFTNFHLCLFLYPIYKKE